MLDVIIFSINKMQNSQSNDKVSKHKGTGHRQRLRERFVQSGLDGFLDYEIVELLLTLGTPMKDCKQMAKDAIKKFKSLKGVLDAKQIDLEQIKGIGPKNAFGLKLFQVISERYAKESIPKKLDCDSTQKVAKYLQEKIGKEKKEYFVVLYLDARHQLLREEVTSIGTLNASLVHPREVFKPAIENSAAAIIVAHNHPSGGTEPSEADIMLTGRLSDAGKMLGIELLDHLVISSEGSRSIL